MLLLAMGISQSDEVGSSHRSSLRFALLLLASKSCVAVDLESVAGVHLPVLQLEWVSLGISDECIQSANVNRLGFLRVSLQCDNVDAEVDAGEHGEC